MISIIRAEHHGYSGRFIQRKVMTIIRVFMEVIPLRTGYGMEYRFLGIIMDLNVMQCGLVLMELSQLEVSHSTRYLMMNLAGRGGSTYFALYLVIITRRRI